MRRFLTRKIGLLAAVLAFLPTTSCYYGGMVVHPNGKLYVQAGGGIVADSQPAAEWQETQSKARALLRAAEMAEAGLDTKID